MSCGIFGSLRTFLGAGCALPFKDPADLGMNPPDPCCTTIVLNYCVVFLPLTIKCFSIKFRLLLHEALCSNFHSHSDLSMGSVNPVSC